MGLLIAAPDAGDSYYSMRRNYGERALPRTDEQRRVEQRLTDMETRQTILEADLLALKARIEREEGANDEPRRPADTGPGAD